MPLVVTSSAYLSVISIMLVSALSPMATVSKSSKEVAHLGLVGLPVGHQGTPGGRGGGSGQDGVRYSTPLGDTPSPAVDPNATPTHIATETGMLIIKVG